MLPAGVAALFGSPAMVLFAAAFLALICFLDPNFLGFAVVVLLYHCGSSTETSRPTNKQPIIVGNEPQVASSEPCHRNNPAQSCHMYT